jgi:alpha-beta hydrolase superfamily lysophospholipase
LPEPAPDLPWGRISPLRLDTADDQDLGAWYIPGRDDRLVVLLLHGNGACRSGCLPEAELAAAAGCPVLMVTHRAHGDSTGEVNDFGLSARRDVVAAIGWLADRCPGRPVVIWGRSLGSAAALFAAPDVGPAVVGYILECPYRDLRTATRNRTRHYLPPVLEYVAYLGFTAVAPAVLPDVDTVSPLKAAGQVPPGPRVLVLAGGADTRATPDDAAAIARALGDRAELVVVPGADHLMLADVDRDGYRRVVTGFLMKCVTDGARPERAP